MPRTVIALFDDLGTARHAEKALQHAGLLGEHLVLTSSELSSPLAGEGVPVIEGEVPMLRSDLASQLEEQGISPEQAEMYAEAIGRGGAALVLLGLDDERAEQASGTLLEHRPIDPSRRLSAHHDAGHAGYNPTATAFTDDASISRNPFADEHHDQVDVIYVM